jgi:hypothetical protein
MQDPRRFNNEKGPMTEPTTSQATICRCELCSGEIEFESQYAGQTVTCPHCAAETRLYIPGGASTTPPVADTFRTDRDGETFYLQDGDVIVTSARFSVASTLFALHQINSVSSATVEKSKIGPASLLAIGVWMVYANIRANPAAVFLGCLVLFLGTVWWIRNATQYQVIITTSAGQQPAFQSRKRLRVDKIYNALTEAIINRAKNS